MNSGRICIVDTEFGSLLKEINFHRGPVLAIRVLNGSVFATGSDSRIISIQHLGGEWRVTSKERGQSHDILCLEAVGDRQLLSGGVTTDICSYRLEKGQFINREI